LGAQDGVGVGEFGGLAGHELEGKVLLPSKRMLQLEVSLLDVADKELGMLLRSMKAEPGAHDDNHLHGELMRIMLIEHGEVELLDRVVSLEHLAIQGGAIRIPMHLGPQLE